MTAVKAEHRNRSDCRFRWSAFNRQEQDMESDVARDARPEAASADQGHLKTFHAARKHLAEQRGSLIKAIGLGYQREQTEAHINLVIKIQNAIDVIDKAID